jgi:enoyl-CoA hydratase/carnithine racemase
VHLERQGRVGIIILEKPPANTFDYGDLQRLGALIDEARYDDQVRAVVIASTLTRFFSAGADVNTFRAASPRQRGMISLLGHEVLRKIEHTPMVFVAAIAGPRLRRWPRVGDGL